MGKIDNIMCRYLRDKERFADFFNGVYFQGHERIMAADLEDASEQYVEMGSPQRFRDIKMRMSHGTTLRILAVENQNLVDYAMPFRCMQYDTMEYHRQLSAIRRTNQQKQDYRNFAEKLCRVKRSDRITPVYTICLYHGEDLWDGPRTLKDMMEFGEDAEFMSAYFTDYPMRLFCVNEETDFSLFHSELKNLFSVMQYRKDRKQLKKLLSQNAVYQKMDEDTLEVLAYAIDVPGIWEQRKRYQNDAEKEVSYNMCQAIREWMEEEKTEGRIEGRTEGEVRLAGLVQRLINAGRMEDLNRALEDQQYRERLYQENGL